MRRILAGLALGALGIAACNSHDTDEPTQSGRARQLDAQAVQAYFVVLEGPGAVGALAAGVDPRSPEAAEATKKRLAAITLEQAALAPLLEAQGAETIASITRLANVIQVLCDEEGAKRIAGLPGVRRVEAVPLVVRSLDSAVPAVGAPAVWGGVPGFAGEGITIGIIDSGIDYTHADFGGPGTSAAYNANNSALIEPGSFPTARVVGGWDFVGDAYNPGVGSSSPQPDADPLDCATVVGAQISGGHGTHVAGIAAGNGVLEDGSAFLGPYAMSTDLGAFRVAPGVAPAASLYALKVFGCQGATTLLASALDRAADPNMDGSFADRLDVVNASLGTPYGLGSTVVGDIVKSLTQVGTLVVAAAGNEGQNFFVTGSPASYPEVLSVAAVTDSDFLTLRVTAPGSAIAAYAASEAIFTLRLGAVGPIASEIVMADPVQGCQALNNAAEVAGKVVLIDRGTCPFVDKLGNAVAAGALAAVVVDNAAAALPFPMTGTPNSSPIPGFMITMSDGAELQAALAQGAVTIGLDPSDRFAGPGTELLAGFSSRGPSPVDGRLKPEIAAPGVAIDSAAVGTGNAAVSNQGTSMASPVVAGAAALLRQARPSLGPLQIKAALMNAAEPMHDAAGLRYGSGVVGAGRLDVARAVVSSVTAGADIASGEVGISFGAIIASEPVTAERIFLVTNYGSSAATFTLSVEPSHELAGLSLAVSPATLELAVGQAQLATLTLSLDPATLGSPGTDPGTNPTQGGQTPQARHYLNQASGVVRMAQTAGPDVILPYTGSVRAASVHTGAAPSACDPAASPDAPVSVALSGPSAHPDPVTTAFELGALDDAEPDAETDPVVAMTDLRAVGVATDLATAASFDEARVFFGVAVSGPWTTAARGPLSIVKIQLDTDEDPSVDYEIRVEARNPDPPHRDALMAVTYDVSTGERLGRLPINILAPDVALTHPFNSSVLVLSALLSEVGVDPQNPVFDWTAATENPLLFLRSNKVKGVFDAGQPRLNAAVHGLDGAPIFLGSDPILVDVSAEARSLGGPLDLLLLHHTNPPGQQWEVVSLLPKSPGNLAIAGAGPAQAVALGETAEARLTVTHSGEELAPNARVTGQVIGGVLVSALTEAGSCGAGPDLDCALQDLAPGASVVVTATVRRTAEAGELAVRATLESDLGCESDTADNSADVTLKLAPPLDDDAEFGPAGGCTCRAAGNGDAGGTSSYAGWLLALAGLWRMRVRARG